MLFVHKGRIDHLAIAEAELVSRLAGEPVPASLVEAQQRLTEVLTGWRIETVGRSVLARRALGEPESLRFVESPVRDSYYDRMEDLETCPECAWVGTGRDLAIGESFDSGAEYHCPACDHYFGFGAYPLITEVMTDPRADPIDRIALELAKRHFEQGETD